MKLFPLALIVCLALTACSSSKKTENSAVDSLQPEEGNHRLGITVAVDGSLKEWPEPLPGYSKETMLHFGVTNDKNFLYIAVACSESQVQQKILRTGMEIYISDNGKKQTLTGIAFPLPSTRMRHLSDSVDGMRVPAQNAGNYKANELAEFTQLQTFGLKSTPDGTYPMNGQNNIKVATGWGDNSFLNIEYAIPLKELFTNVLSINNSNLQVGFKLNGFGGKDSKRQSGSYGNNGGSGMRGGGMRGGGMNGGGGMRGGGMRGGGMRQNGEGMQRNNGMSETNRDQSFWTKYTVSTKGE